MSFILGSIVQRLLNHLSKIDLYSNFVYFVCTSTNKMNGHLKKTLQIGKYKNNNDIEKNENGAKGSYNQFIYWVFCLSVILGSNGVKAQEVCYTATLSVASECTLCFTASD